MCRHGYQRTPQTPATSWKSWLLNTPVWCNRTRLGIQDNSSIYFLSCYPTLTFIKPWWKIHFVSRNGCTPHFVIYRWGVLCYRRKFATLIFKACASSRQLLALSFHVKMQLLSSNQYCFPEVSSSGFLMLIGLRALCGSSSCDYYLLRVLLHYNNFRWSWLVHRCAICFFEGAGVLCRETNIPEGTFLSIKQCQETWEVPCDEFLDDPWL